MSVARFLLAPYHTHQMLVLVPVSGNISAGEVSKRCLRNHGPDRNDFIELHEGAEG
jgi:hypothetical protein